MAEKKNTITYLLYSSILSGFIISCDVRTSLRRKDFDSASASVSERNCMQFAVLLAKKETGFAKIFCIAFPTFMFVLIGAEHSVADAFYLVGGNLGVLFWVLLGNIFGGSLVSFFAFKKF